MKLVAFKFGGKWGWKLLDAAGKTVPPSPRSAVFATADLALSDARAFASKLTAAAGTPSTPTAGSGGYSGGY